MLIDENKTLVDQCSKLKTLMVAYEKDALYQRLESNYIYEELAKENDNLKRLLLINHDFTDSIESRIKEIEKEEQDRKLQKFRELKELQERAEEKLRESLAEAKKEEDQRNNQLDIHENSFENFDDLDRDDDDTDMPDEVKKIVEQRL